MNPSDRYAHVESLYHAARERPLAERAAFLDAVCAGDVELRREVESLLAQPETGRGLLDMPVPGVDGPVSSFKTPSLTGRQFGAYEIRASIGAGGMGEVYRARDSKLGRDVAIKILPTAFSSDPDRRARFDREARVLAALNHPHIGAIYGVEESDGIQALVLELIDGETLAERIARGPIPIGEALTIARQITEAIDAAHEKGIVHRDLKPANIKITPDGIVKVLDFGLATTASAHGSSPDLTRSPTVTMGGTRDGMLLGTAAYMSPEQARGKVSDKRTDVWAFGCVLYETLTGRVAFGGDTLSDIIAAILGREPDWSALPPATPAPIRRLLVRCLDKDAKRRLRDIGDARTEIEDVLSGVTAFAPSAAIVPGSAKRRRWLAAASLTTALALGAAGGWAVEHFRPAPEAKTRTLDILVPRNGQLLLGTNPSLGGIALSPDGTTAAIVAAVDGKAGIWLIPLDGSPPQPVPGTDNAAYPFWKPDSTSLGFFAGGFLWRVDLKTGAAPFRVTAVAGGGGAWLENDIVLIGMQGSGLLQVPASGGAATPLTHLEEGETGHVFPQALPRGRFLYSASRPPEGNAVYGAAFDDPDQRKLIVRGSPSALYASGSIIFMRGRALMAQPFDPVTLESSGRAASLGESWRGLLGQQLNASVSSNGILLYDADGPRNQLTWMDRMGSRLATVGEPGNYGSPRVSHNDASVVVQEFKPDGDSDLLTLDSGHGRPSRFTTERGMEHHPLWSPDDRTVVFSTLRDLFGQAVEGDGTRKLIESSSSGRFATDWRDGFILFYEVGGTKGRDLGTLEVTETGERKQGATPKAYLSTVNNESWGRFSPEPMPHWVAYQSDESGHNEVYVDSFPKRRRAVPISTGGGTYPQWGSIRGDRGELFYVSADGHLMVAELRLGEQVEVVGTTELFPLAPGETLAGYSPYDTAHDGQRFLIRTPVDAVRSLTVIENWPARLAASSSTR